MYKYFIGAGVLGLVTLAYHPGSVPQQQTQAQLMAKALAPILPKDVGNGVSIDSAKAEGDVLAFHVDIPGNTGLTTSEMEKVVAASFCAHDGSSKFFEQGAKLRIDISTDGGTPDQGPVISSCS